MLEEITINYVNYSLNGTWSMGYSEDVYTSTECPNTEYFEIENAVPGYWEDMVEKFSYAPFFSTLRSNNCGIQKYPIVHTAPDMTLPNIAGNFYYKKIFLCNKNAMYEVIHFDGVQNSVSVWINNVFINRHEGYSTPFDIDIPKGVLKHGENTITLSVSNHRLYGVLNEPISGLTSRAANENTGGITGNIELRLYNSHLRDVAVFISEDCKSVSAKIHSTKELTYDWYLLDNSKVLKSGHNIGDLTFSTDGLCFWSPESPQLYTLKIAFNNSFITTSFGIRRLTVDDIHFKLNGNPYFLRGICEHCYSPYSVHPEHNISNYRKIIKTVKKLGFNFIRFHTHIPFEEYMQAADELGMLIQVESPNNTTLSEWKEIINFCRKHPSVVIYCCGNELLLDESFIEHLDKCADVVHQNTDALFSPMSALRGVEYYWNESEHDEKTLHIPFDYHPERLNKISKFSDMYNSYTQGLLSYFSLDADAKKIDSWNELYNKPRVSHEICIDGTYTDLSLKDRYKNTRIGNTQMFSSIEKHLEEKGLLDKAPIYFKNSSEWQRRLRKYCFEMTRRCENMAGFDFLGPIDTHWHTFGYDVGMMNEFYELKPGETIRNVLMYNSETILLSDIERNTNFESGENHNFKIYASCYNKENISYANLNLYLMVDNIILKRISTKINVIENGKVSKLYEWNITMPKVENPLALKLYATLDTEEMLVENEWELYVFPNCKTVNTRKIVLLNKTDEKELTELLESGEKVVLFGAGPFKSLPTSFRIALAGRTSGNLATVIYDHPLLKNIPHNGFCGWQFNHMMENASAICFENNDIPFNPIIEVVSTHKFAIKQSSLFEYNVLNGKLIVCSFNFNENDAAARWFKHNIISYAESEEFTPQVTIDAATLHSLINGKVSQTALNTNFAFNANDITALRKNC